MTPDRLEGKAMTTTKQPALPELLPCPWCGSEQGPTSQEGSTYRWKTCECAVCGAGPGEIRKTADLLTAWNTRAGERERAGREGGWISVAERLPEYEGVRQHLVYAPNRFGLRVISEHPSHWNTRSRRGLLFDGEPVTHWHTLPQPPTAPQERSDG